MPTSPILFWNTRPPPDKQGDGPVGLGAREVEPFPQHHLANGDEARAPQPGMCVPETAKEQSLTNHRRS